jgi:hypothetical protein
MKPSARWQVDVDKLIAFREAYIKLLNASKVGGDWMDRQLVPKGSGAEWNRLRTEVATAAGVAAFSYNRSGGGTLILKNAAYVMNNVNPVTNWAMSIADPQQLPPETVLGSVETAIGVATSERDEAKQRERGFVGLVAAFLRWPSDLREAVGPSKAQRRAAGAIGLLGQVVVATMSTALAAGIVAGAIAIWQLLF